MEANSVAPTQPQVETIASPSASSSSNSKNLTPFSIADILSKPTPPPTPHSDFIQRMLIPQYPPPFHPWLCFTHPWPNHHNNVIEEANNPASSAASSGDDGEEDDQEEIDEDDEDEEFIDDFSSESMDSHHMIQIISHHDHPIDMRAQPPSASSNSSSNRSRKY